MTREIKFRAWDGERMKQVTVWGFSEGFIMTPKGSAPVEEYKVMQFTGLLDKNGVEIYEGDILKIETNCDDFCEGVGGTIEDICSVYYEESKVRFETSYIKSNHTLPFSNGFERLYLEYIEVIGNIYQNPELLS